MKNGDAARATDKRKPYACQRKSIVRSEQYGCAEKVRGNCTNVQRMAGVGFQRRRHANPNA
ncbi:MAG: hypothetical protein E6043_07095, partial [Slackia sp.]|nr:hypothetical protein [Slackia sp.]